MKVTQLYLTLCEWTIESMEISRPEYWSRQPIPPPMDLPDPGIEPGPPALQVDPPPAELAGRPGWPGEV